MLDSLRRRVAGWIAPESRSVPTEGSVSLSEAMAIPTQAGPAVTDRTALGIAAVWRAVSLYASTIASLDLEVARKDDRGGASPAPEHWAFDLVRCRPNGYTTGFNFWQSLLAHPQTQGNGYAEIEWGTGNRKALGLHLMDPRYVEPEIDDDRRLGYKLTQQGETLPSADVLHIRGLGWGGIKGYSPIAIARETLGVAVAQQQYEAGIFGNSAQATGHLEMPGTMNTTQQAQFRDNWNAIHQGTGNAGKVGILVGGAKWVQTSFSPADAQLILGKGFSVAEVARIWGVPPHMLGLMEGATVGNVEQQGIQFFLYSLSPWLRAVVGELDAKLLSRQERAAGYFFRYDHKAFLLGDMAARSAYNRSMFDMGAFSINRVLLNEGYNPIDNPAFDKHWIPTNNLAAVEDLDRAPTQPAGNVAPDPTPAPAAPPAGGQP